MTATPATVVRGASTTARWLIACALVTLATVKLLSPPRPPLALTGLADLLATPHVVGSACVLEFALGLGMASKWHAIVVRAVAAWLAILSGILVALVIAGAPVASCGCFGSRTAPLASRIAVLAGLCILTALASRPPRGDSQH